MTSSIFPIQSINRLAKLLETPRDVLCGIADRAESLYRDAHLLVAGKAPRAIQKPKSQLARLQRLIFERLFIEFRPHDCSYGGKGKGIEFNAIQHLGCDYVLKIDLRKFYPNVHYAWVQAFFERRLGCIPPVASILRRLLTFKKGLPQGACTSTAVADQVLWAIDTRLHKALGARNIVYTRWVDDITVSAAFSLRTYIPFIERVFKAAGLRIHRQGDKRPTQFGPGEDALVTGLAITRDGISIPSCYVARIKAELQNAMYLSEGSRPQLPIYCEETYWGMIQYIRRFSQKDADELMKLFRRVRWEELTHLNLPSKKGIVVDCP